MIFQRKNKGRKANPRGAGNKDRQGWSEGAIASVRKHTSLSVPEGILQSVGVGVMAAIPALLCS